MAQAPIDLAQTLSKNKLCEVPARFVQPSERRAIWDGNGSIPVIDLKALQEDGDGNSQTIQRIAKACEEWGIFQVRNIPGRLSSAILCVCERRLRERERERERESFLLQVVNHGISASLMENVKSLVKGFLDLPMEEKLKRPMKFESYHPTGYGRLFDISKDTILDWVDALIHYLSPPALKDPDYWPEGPAGYRETIEAYGREVQRLTKTLLSVLSDSLGFSPSHLEHAFGGENAQVILRVNHYPRCPQADVVLGLSPHSDGTIMTVLLHDEVEGLQVKKDGCWWTVKPMPGALIVNMGDMMELASNGRFTSIEHRAVVSKDMDRISVVVFYIPTVDVVIGPAAPPDDKQPYVPLYKSVKYGDYLANYMNKELQGKGKINSLLI